MLVHLTMRTIMIAVSLVGCGAKPADKADAWHAVDLALLGGVSRQAARDLDALFLDRRPHLMRCADPVRPLVRQEAPGYGSIPVVLRVVGARGRQLEIRSVSVTPRLPASYDGCVRSALRGVWPVVATGDYRLAVRLNICIDPGAGPEAP